jgi:putative spermidine/putrescine transport system permease protein
MRSEKRSGRAASLDFDRLTLRAVLGALTAVAVVLLVVPAVIVVVVSFTSAYSLRFPPPGWSLRWYAALYDAWQLQFAAANSFEVALWTTAISVVLGVSAALGIARSRSVAALALEALFMSPLMLPGIAFGLSALMFFSLIGLPLSILTLVLGHTVVCVPFVLRVTMAALAQLDPALLECSASLGASALYGFRRITLPLIAPGIAAGGFLAFMSSFDNVIVSLFLRSAGTDMLPIRMWQDVEGQLDVRVAAVSSLLIVLTMVLLVGFERLSGFSQRIR